MIERQNGGKIINVGSMYSLCGAPDFSDYAAAKTGIIGLTRSLAVELGKYNIQVNAILPGWYETDMTRGMQETPLGGEIRRHTPLSRWGSPSDLTALLSAGHWKGSGASSRAPSRIEFGAEGGTRTHTRNYPQRF
jgi:2-deoxy-D-gluconate 3-dehydrogenase